MSGFTPIVIECLSFIAVFAIADAITRPLRRAITGHEHPDRGMLRIAKNLIGLISRPLAVLVLSELVLGILRLNPWMKECLLQIPHHLAAWLSFWLIVLSIDLVEGITRQAFIVRGRPFPIPELLASIMRTILLVAAAFVVIKVVLDIDISPLLASTALVTAVVGFALQGVLSNLLAGMSLHLTRSVLPSDWVRIDAVEGQVLDTNWRETRLRTASGHTMIIPNSTVAGATIHNMSWPTPLRRHLLPVGASYSDAPGDVIDALVQSALNVPEVLRDPPPDAYVTEFKDFGINYALRFWTHEYHKRLRIEGHVARMIWYQFKRRGIEIPFPMSDKLLEDFMTVVFHQRRLPPEDDEITQRIADLKASDFWTRTLVDAEGKALLQDEDLQQVVSKMRRNLYTPGETLFCQGDSGDTCYVVVKGSLHGRVEYDDTTLPVEFDVGPGALLGEMSLMTGLPRTATVSVQEEAELLEIPQDAFASLLSLHPEVPVVLSQLVADRAATNAAALERLKSIVSEDLQQTLRQENILKRFLRMIGCGSEKEQEC
jgi:small-conductance mechanosensitive channel/CRP-like cAMP-binding protein